MFKALDKFFNSLNESNIEPVLSTHELNLAIASLMIEVARIDQHFDDAEWDKLQSLLIKECKLSTSEAKELSEEAKRATSDASSLFEFTKKINDNCDYAQRVSLIEGLWAIAYADGELDKYEEHIIRRISDLIYLTHSDFIKAKIKVRDKKN